MRVKDKESFIQKSNLKHDFFYDYGRVVYLGTRVKVEIGCPVHGWFHQTPEAHSSAGKGCDKCVKDRMAKMFKKPVAEVKKDFERAHGSFYDYSRITDENYVNTKTDVEIGCPTHGWFPQDPASHKKGAGCPKCCKNYKDTEDFILSAKIKRKDSNVLFDKVKYKNSYTAVTLICPLHGDYKQRPDNFLNGSEGCGECETRGKKIPLKDYVDRLSTNKQKMLIEESYINISSKVNLQCDIHGFFEQKAYLYQSGKGCPDCVVDSQKLLISDIRKRAQEIHGDKDMIGEINYINNITPVEIFCKKHGSYDTTISNYLAGHRCPKCVSIISKPEIEVANLVKELGFEILTSKRNIIKPYELDIYIPSLRKAIEFNGDWWHYNHSNPNCKPKGYHAQKSNLCREKGIRLLYIREDLWKKDPEKMIKVIQKFIEDEK